VRSHASALLCPAFLEDALPFSTPTFTHTKHETFDERFTTSRPPNIINFTPTTEQTTIRNGRRQGYAHHLDADALLARKILRVANTYDLLQARLAERLAARLVVTHLERRKSRTLRRLDSRYVARAHEMEAEDGAGSRAVLCGFAQNLFARMMRRDRDPSCTLCISALYVSI
jgi:hypothetical protein